MGDSTLLFLFSGYAIAFVAILAYVVRLTFKFRTLEAEADRLSDMLSNRGTSK